MGKLIFDIETAGKDFESLDKTTQEDLTKYLDRKSLGEKKYLQELQKIKDNLGLSPLTGEIIALGVLDSNSDKGAVYFQSPAKKLKTTFKKGLALKPMTEKEILKQFWEICQRYNEFVTFNGRGFDAPFIIIRSAVHRLKPTKNLMSNRYLSNQKFNAVHIDLMDQLSFYGATSRRSLQMWTQAFGIKSPKQDGVSGKDVSRYFKQKKYLEIALYNLGDLFATRELYRFYEKYLMNI